MALGRRETADGYFGDDFDDDDFVIANPMSRPKRRGKSRIKRKNRTTKRRARRRKHKRVSRRSSKRTGKVRRTKNGQPYIILPNGRAKFIKRRN